MSLIAAGLVLALHTGSPSDPAPHATSVATVAAFVAVPADYVYDLDHPDRTYHDYCSYSPDAWFKADFRGPCARHDMCYERGDVFHTCNVAFLADLQTNCRYAYATSPVSLKTCLGVAKTYYTAVDTVHPVAPGRPVD